MQIKRERELKGSIKKGEIKEHIRAAVYPPHIFLLVYPFLLNLNVKRTVDKFRVKSLNNAFS